MKRTRDIWGPGATPDMAPEAERCAIPGCTDRGEYKAPRSRQALRDYIWLCLDHVRAYNASWNYYDGMNEVQIEAHRRADATWRRPTWPLGARGARASDGGYRMRDDFGLFDDDWTKAGASRDGAKARYAGPMTEGQQALALLDLAPPVTLATVKARYKELVKRLHPDANGGDKEAEERLKLVNQAYSTLTRSDLLLWEIR